MAAVPVNKWKWDQSQGRKRWIWGSHGKRAAIKGVLTQPLGEHSGGTEKGNEKAGNEKKDQEHHVMFINTDNAEQITSKSKRENSNKMAVLIASWAVKLQQMLLCC